MPRQKSQRPKKAARAKPARRRTLLPEFAALMATAPKDDTRAELDADRGER